MEFNGKTLATKTKKEIGGKIFRVYGGGEDIEYLF